MSTSDISPESLEARVKQSVEWGETIKPSAQELAETLASMELLTQEPQQLPALLLQDEASPEGDLCLISTLGQGGMGIVYLAHQRALKRDVAVKRPRSDRETDEETNVHQILLREAQVVGSLEHPNIIPVYALGEAQDGQPALVMKKVEGVVWKTLLEQPDHHLMRQHKGDPLQLHLEIMRKVCHAIEFAHSRSILHRDLKADNVMVGAFGEVYVLDWGIAWPTDAPAPPSIVGTMGYLAPEMVALEPLTERTDVFLLGALLHEVLTGRPRFEAEITAALLVASLAAEPASFPPDVPRELADICNQATSRKPENRYPSARAFREAIEAFLEHRSSRTLAQQGLEHLEAFQQLCKHAPASSSKDEGDIATLQALRDNFTEASLLFRSALQMWPENPEAKDGQDRLLRAMLSYEMAENYLDNARHLLRQIEAPEPDLLDGFAAMEQQHAAEKRRIEALEQMASDSDLGRDAQLRMTLFGSFLGVGILGTILVGWLLRSTGYQPGYRDAIAITLTSNMFWFVVYVLLKRRGGHKATLQIIAAVITMVFLTNALYAICWYYSIRIYHAMQISMLMIATHCILLGVVLRPSFAWCAVVIGCGIIGATIYPTYWLEWNAGCFLMFYLQLVWIELSHQKSAPATTQPSGAV